MTVMDWSSVDPVGEIEQRIHVYEDDRTVKQHRLEEAVAVLHRSEAVSDGARAVIDECRGAISFDTQEIAALRDDLRSILPNQRPAT